MPGISYTLGLDARPAMAGLNAMRGALSGFTGMIGKLGPLAGFAGGIGVAGAAVMGFKKAIDEAATMEGFEIGFQTLLGTAQAATARMRDLTKFAADTPFELGEVAQASRTLETLTKGALSTGKGLTLVGDVASAAQQPFAELATHIGRLYDGLQGGRPVGEAMARLQELGLIAGDVREKIEQMQSGGQKGQSVWAVAQAELQRFSGGMKLQSQSWNGLMSTFKDSVNAVFREFGTPILPQLKPILSDGITLTEQLAASARKWGENTATAIGFFRNASQAGKLGEVAGLSLKVGFGQAVQFLIESLATAIVKLRPHFTNLFDGLDMGFMAIAKNLAATIKEAIAESLPNSRFWSSTKNRLGEGASMDRFQAKAIGEAAMDALGSVPGISAAGGLLTSSIADAQSQLAQHFRTMAPAIAPALASAISAAVAPASAGLAQNVRAPQMTALSDRLSRIGGFIGGSGGVRGQKAQEDTARHTKQIVTEITKLQLITGSLKTGNVGGVF